jgi:dephospho-CoA kinase
MIKIGITGSIASGKSTASRILSKGRGKLFSADEVVKNLYNNSNFKKLIIKKFSIEKNLNFKSSLKDKILKNKNNIKKLENVIHPLVRKEMIKFTKKNKNQKTLFYEIPLLIESKLTKYFDIIFFIKTKKKIRLKRFKLKGGKEKLFNFLNNKQLSDTKKTKFCDHIIINEKNLNILKRRLLSIINLYE